MEPKRAEEQIEDLREARDRGLGEEGRTKEEQDRAMMGDAATEERPDAGAEEAGATRSEDERPER